MSRTKERAEHLESEFAPLAWKTVLLVENDEPLRTIGVQLLALAGAEVFACETVEQARALLTEHLPDYVITDVELPDDAGRALAHELHAQPDLQGVFVIALAPPGMPAHALIPEFDAVLYKPDNYLNVVDTLRELQLPEERPRQRFAVRAGDRIFVSDGGDAVGLVHQVRDDGLFAHIDKRGQVFVPARAVAAHHQGKVLLDLSKLDDELVAAIAAAD